MQSAGRLMRGAFAILGLVVVSHGAALAEPADAVERTDLPIVTLATASQTEIVARVPVSGSLVARREVQVHANVSGYEVTEIRAEIGDRVKAGDLLARLSDAELTVQLAQAEAEYQSGEASVRQAESQIANAEALLTEAVAALGRTRSLRSSGNASQAVLDQAIASEASARALSEAASNGLGVARAALARAEAARRLAQLNLDYTRIVAPVDGLIIGRSAERGTLSGTGGEPLFTLVAGGEIELAADVIETALNQLRPGDPAEIQVAGLGLVTGSLRLIPAAVDPVTRLGIARVSLQPEPGLRVGLFASGWIITDRREAVTVPSSAVLSDGTKELVQVVSDGLVEAREVRAGLIWQGRREILQGLRPGEKVIARAGAFFSSGDRVRETP
ncbi:RND family efflux transporter, MFP subunit [Paracoccus halophilus]|uniref:Fis family transcriptional regulator n=1 Tax=Paracoccus halophilus TaxID=376733 RepID=A0A099F8D5_9RHOB|nr:efflux RND transporter periplasmic adaptor subunit [Paracoccus halophilus]KGJ06486.1 Fis family transcriptional regulator [Paracoccus halophilus]SFA38027.1 RND family efflux transporter, MFP subunit [Paracoccus halophilus]